MLMITKENFKECVEKYDTLIIDFYADWCNPCTALGGMIDRIMKNYPNVTVGKVNIDEEEELAGAFGVSSIPFVVKIVLIFDFLAGRIGIWPALLPLFFIIDEMKR